MMQALCGDCGVPMDIPDPVEMVLTAPSHGRWVCKDCLRAWLAAQPKEVRDGN